MPKFEKIDRVMELLKHGEFSVDEISQKLQLPRDRVEEILRVLAENDFVEKENGTYRLTKIGKEFLEL